MMTTTNGNGMAQCYWMFCCLYVLVFVSSTKSPNQIMKLSHNECAADFFFHLGFCRIHYCDYSSIVLNCAWIELFHFSRIYGSFACLRELVKRISSLKFSRNIIKPKRYFSLRLLNASNVRAYLGWHQIGDAKETRKWERTSCANVHGNNNKFSVFIPPSHGV